MNREGGAECRLGYAEYDGARYCHEHGGFLEPGIQSARCDLAPCLRCGFDPKRFEPRPEKQRGAARWHRALHESGRVLPATPCTDCTSPAEVTDCRADTGDRCGPCHVATCAECQDELADQDAAEAARDGKWS